MTGHKEELTKEYNQDGEGYSFIFRSTLSAATTVNKKKQKSYIGANLGDIVSLWS